MTLAGDAALGISFAWLRIGTGASMSLYRESGGMIRIFTPALSGRTIRFRGGSMVLALVSTELPGSRLELPKDARPTSYPVGEVTP
jgi:hypothetical protein